MLKVSPAKLQDILKDSASRCGVPGAVLALRHEDELNVITTGVLNVETEDAVLPDSMFQVGSVTKVLTTTVIMKLVEKGLVELDAPVCNYFPEFRTADLKAAQEVTLRQILTHTSGLDGDVFTDTGSGPERIAKYVERCALLPHIFRPGERFSYSNAAFVILGRVIELVTELTFDEALKKFLIEPMGLRNTLSNPSDLAERSISFGHIPGAKESDKPICVPTPYILPMSSAPAGTTLYMSAGDLVSFVKVHLNSGIAENGTRILAKDSTLQMQNVHVELPIQERDIIKWGLGWMITKADDGLCFGHDGVTVGQNAYLRIHRETGTIAVLFVNGGAANDCMMEVFSEVLDPITSTQTNSRLKGALNQPDDLTIYEGVYRNIGGDTTVYIENGRLMRAAFIRIDDLLLEYPPLELCYVGDHSFMFTQPSHKYPDRISFLDLNALGVPQTVFSGLRVFCRVN